LNIQRKSFLPKKTKFAPKIISMNQSIIEPSVSTLYDAYETVIGLEIHVQLATKSKAFCSDDARFGGAPNTHLSAISLAHPGTLPRPNSRHIEFAVRLGLALGCNIKRTSYFDRKNYFYADLPKGYQITQDRQPTCMGGAITIPIGNDFKTIRFHHIHLEEDAGKSLHDTDSRFSHIDLNRAGVPLLEIVTEPDLRSGEEVDALMTAMRHLVRWLDISDGNMEEGSMRCDVNISVRKRGQTTYGTRCEVKNVNSMKFARRAVAYEVRRQIDLLEKGGQVSQQTLNFDPQTGITTPLRSKENAHDYRYFPDPDLAPVVLSEALLSKIKAEMPILPADCRQLLVETYQLSYKDALILTEEKAIAAYYQGFVQACPAALHKAAANLVIQKILPFLQTQHIDIENYPLSHTQLIDLLQLIENKKINASAAYQTLLPALLQDNTGTTTAMAEKLNLFQNTDTAWLEPLIQQVIAQHPDKVAAFRKGKKGLSAFFVGETMKLAKGKADPKVLNLLVNQFLNA
jgi:aspartyl-tRNA(Asn)/glutamyl-tRNA(Gln) amidotransferase subunit B